MIQKARAMFALGLKNISHPRQYLQKKKPPCMSSHPLTKLWLTFIGYATLVRNGEAEIIASTHDLSAIRGLEDEEIRDAVEELKRSTSVIEKQSEALRLQQNAMSSLIKNKSRSNQARAQSEKSQLRIWNTEKIHTSASVSSSQQGF